MTTCLFLCFTFGHAQQTEWLGDKELYTGYTFALNLQFDEARKYLDHDLVTYDQFYVLYLMSALELMVTEDDSRFNNYEDKYESLLDLLKDAKTQSAELLFLTAELRLQWAFVYLKFGHEFDAAWNIRQAYLTVQECKKKYPAFVPIKKTSGLLEIMLGSVPEKYQWVMNLFSMQGTVDAGLKELEQVRAECPSLNLETSLLYYLFQGFILQQTEIAVQGFDELIQSSNGNKLALFLGASIAIKNAQSEKALTYLKQLNEEKAGLTIAYVNYQLGEVYLHKGEYESSIRSYQDFVNTYRGQNYIKDAYYKIGICYWLMGNSSDAKKYFIKASEEGKESAEADKYASRSLSENTYPNVKLSKIRYATDGGYYEDAEKVVSTVTEKDLPHFKDKIEFIYRKGRLYHKNGSLQEARKSYLETITKQEDENWYFAPNACLQLGYMFLEAGQQGEAKKYFEKALTYKKHEYKNSIDSKAKSALARLKK